MRDETRSSAITDARIIHRIQTVTPLLARVTLFWVPRAFSASRASRDSPRVVGAAAETLISRGSSANKMPVLSCLRPAADAPVAMEDEDEYPTARRARAFSRLVDAPAHDTSDFASNHT